MRIRMLLGRLRADQEGIAIPTVMIVTSIGFAFVTVGLVSSVNAQRGTVRDQDSKAALAAAEAGANVALMRSNRYLTGTTQCVFPSGSWSGAPLTTGTATSGWCPAVSGTVGRASWTYQQSSAVSTAGTTQATTIVATGYSGNVTRRVAVTVQPESGASIFADEGVATSENITLGGNPSIYTNMGANGSIGFNGSAAVCGTVRYGAGDSLTGTNTCPGYPVTEGDKAIAPLSESFRRTLLMTNRNCQIARTCSPAASYTKGGSYWNAATRTINIAQNATLTLPTGDYLICRFFGTNGSLVIPTGATVRIFFDTPEACGLANGATQLSTAGNFNIDSTGYNPQTGLGTLPGFYFFGSPYITTVADFGGGSSANEFVFYGPYTAVTMRGNVSYTGAFAAKSINITGNATIRAVQNLDYTSIPTTLMWRQERFIECVPGTNPAQGC